MLNDDSDAGESPWYRWLFRRRRVSQEQLRTRYREILAALLPRRFLTADGLLRTPSGAAEQVRFEVHPRAPRARARRKVSAFVANIADRALRRHLRLREAEYGTALVKEISRFATTHFQGDQPTRIVLCDVGDGLFVHEVFHDIQAYFDDHHPDTHAALLAASQAARPEVERLFQDTPHVPLLPGIVAYEPKYAWVTSYQLSDLFPSSADTSPYANFYDAVQERFGWRTLFGIVGAIEAATIELCHQEVIPTLLTGVAGGDERVAPVLQRIFYHAGLNTDFEERLVDSPHALRASPAPLTRSREQETAASLAAEQPEHILSLLQDEVAERLPSLPGRHVRPRRRPSRPGRCPRCDAPAVHVVLTNIMVLPAGGGAFAKLQARRWRRRPVAVDVLGCSRHTVDHLDGSAYPLLLKDATVAALADRCRRSRLQGLFDAAEIFALRLVHARPTQPEPRLGYADVLLDRLKLTRLRSEMEPTDAANDRPTCIRQATEALASVGPLERAPTARTLITSARLALETGDPGTAADLLRQARAARGARALQAEFEAVDADIRDFTALPD